jgi:hypothetical protein
MQASKSLEAIGLGTPNTSLQFFVIKQQLRQPLRLVV